MSITTPVTKFDTIVELIKSGHDDMASQLLNDGDLTKVSAKEADQLIRVLAGRPKDDLSTVSMPQGIEGLPVLSYDEDYADYHWFEFTVALAQFLHRDDVDLGWIRQSIADASDEEGLFDTEIGVNGFAIWHLPYSNYDHVSCVIDIDASAGKDTLIEESEQAIIFRRVDIRFAYMAEHVHYWDGTDSRWEQVLVDIQVARKSGKVTVIGKSADA